ncbi:MAG: hypothetical protein K6G90_05610 [Clostridia bacterium]|nr:hypothetical protein [Clostridia bacterium]
MKKTSKLLALLLTLTFVVGLCACGGNTSVDTGNDTSGDTVGTEQSENSGTTVISSDSADKADIETALNLANIKPEWTYSENSDAWTMAIVTAVTNAELPDYQGVSVCVPGAYVKGVDTDGDGAADATDGTASGNLVIDYDAQITSTNGQIYTAATAPVIVNTGAAGYSSQSNQTAGSTYAADGYINVACGNRGKQSTLSDGTYTGDAPSCLVDQKNAVRFVKFNILLGNLPGSVDYFVSTGGSGGGAHATMLAATSDNPAFYEYEISQGAVGVYKNSDGSYSTTVTVDGNEVALSDGMWGCMAYSAITSLAEADMALAFEYYLDTNYSFNTDFQKQTAEYLAAEYMEYINGKNLSVKETDVGFDLNSDGDTDDTVALTIEYDADAHSDTNGYYGTYVDLYLSEFEQSLGDYIARLAYAEDWTWFDSDGNALSDSEVASMTDADRAESFISGAYAKGSTGSTSGGMEGGPGGMEGGPDGDSTGGPPDMSGDSAGGPPDMSGDSSSSDNAGGPPDMNGGSTEEVGTPDSGTTQSASSKTDSSNYSSFDEMLAAYQADIAEIEAGDAYGNNIVELYDPTSYIGADGTNDPTWARILMGASEGDISMFNSLNLQIAWLSAGTDAEIEWQWNGGHVPSEIFGDSLALYVDTMYGKYVDGAVQVSKAAATGQTANGTATEATGTDLSSWVSYDSTNGITMTLAGAADYRTSGASKAIPGFDVMDYGQEDYVFGSSTSDARHWNKYLLKVFEENSDTLSSLFNAGN